MVSIQRPRELFFDDISIGYGYVGDLTTPNVASRLHRLVQCNFHRFILKKNIGERAWTSVDYAFESGLQTWREAIRIRATELRLIDTFHSEIHQITGLHSGDGFAVYGEKTILPKFIAGGGYTDIDRPMLNSDRYGRGNRLFLTVKVPINRAFSVVMFATQGNNACTDQCAPAADRYRILLQPPLSFAEDRCPWRIPAYAAIGV